MRESILHAEHIEQEIIDAVVEARRRMWTGKTRVKKPAKRKRENPKK